jgi:predicted TIM-barrel fold metal-dependent hydrolase
MHVARAADPLESATWAAFWDAVADSGLIASFHLVLTRELLAGLDEHPSHIYRFSKTFIQQFLDPVVGILGEGVLERRPGVRLVLAESGLGWLPWLVQEMDYRYERLVEMRAHWEPRGGIGLASPPSETFRRQVWVTFQDDQVGLDLLDHFGEDKVMWACDYPHPDSTFPESRAVIQRLTADLPDTVRRRLLHDNAAALYRLPGA